MRDFHFRETEINQHYWSFVASSEHSAYRARKFKKVDACTRSTRLFRASGADASRIPNTVTDWLSANDELKNWLRLSVLVSATSNLEMYLGHVARTALTSDPLAQHGKPRALDGVCLLKADIELPYEGVVKGLTKGHWDSREAQISNSFGINLLDIREKKTELEDIRRIRNEFAHGFGRSTDVPDPGIITKSKSNRLSQDKLKKYLGVISLIARSIDRHLMAYHIGSFELIKDYHVNIKQLESEAQQSGRVIEEILKLHTYRKFGITLSKRFFADLITHYNRCHPELAT